MKSPSIAQIRDIIDAAIWNARDLDGATREEFARMDVPARLLPHLDKLETLTLPERFSRERERRVYAVELIDKQISRWRRATGREPLALPIFATIQ